MICFAFVFSTNNFTEIRNCRQMCQTKEKVIFALEIEAESIWKSKLSCAARPLSPKVRWRIKSVLRSTSIILVFSNVTIWFLFASIRNTLILFVEFTLLFSFYDNSDEIDGNWKCQSETVDDRFCFFFFNFICPPRFVFSLSEVSFGFVIACDYTRVIYCNVLCSFWQIFMVQLLFTRDLYHFKK